MVFFKKRDYIKILIMNSKRTIIKRIFSSNGKVIAEAKSVVVTSENTESETIQDLTVEINSSCSYSHSFSSSSTSSNSSNS